jgi:hypothetical protein
VAEDRRRTLLVLTDRNDLDGERLGTFEACEHLRSAANRDYRVTAVTDGVATLWAISRSASSGSWVSTHRPLKAAWT